MYNCYNKGVDVGSELVGINYNSSNIFCSYGKDEVTVNLLNQKPESIQEELELLNLYRSNAWKSDGENIILDWEK